MDIAVDISMYPLDAQFIAPIKDFIARVSASGRCKVVTNSLSTQIFGSYEDVLGVLGAELRVSLGQQQAAGGKAVFVMKLLGPLTEA
jgi:uncharacterized protein YqgV (UPF0045/DUF77 family)